METGFGELYAITASQYRCTSPCQTTDNDTEPPPPSRFKALFRRRRDEVVVQDNGSIPLLQLPLNVRNKILEQLVANARPSFRVRLTNIYSKDRDRPQYYFAPPPLARSCRQLRAEVMRIHRSAVHSTNLFIEVFTTEPYHDCRTSYKVLRERNTELAPLQPYLTHGMRFTIDLIQGYLRFHYEFRTTPADNHTHPLLLVYASTLSSSYVDPDCLQSSRHVFGSWDKFLVVATDDLSLLIEMLLKDRCAGGRPYRKVCAVSKEQQRRTVTFPNEHSNRFLCECQSCLAFWQKRYAPRSSSSGQSDEKESLEFGHDTHIRLKI